MSTGDSKRSATESEPKGNEASSSRKKRKKSPEETDSSLSSGATASGGTTLAATVMNYGDDVGLGTVLKEEDYVEDFPWIPFKLYTLGMVRTMRKDGGEIWDYLLRGLKDPTKLTNILDQTSTLVSGRMAEQNYGFDEKMAHELDVTALEDRIMMIEKWHTDPKMRDKHLAPLLAIIQSSGTGKSRLMNCVRNKASLKSTSRTILLAASTFDQGKKSQIKKDFDDIYIVQKNDSKTKQRSNFVAFVRDQCSKALENSGVSNLNNKQFVRLFFDEAQHLAYNDGLLIRALRWITREVNCKSGDDKRSCFLTVVLAGTNSALANYFPETEQKAGESRTTDLEGGHYEKGTVPFPPFFMLRTMGCLSLSSDKSENGGAMSTNKSEYASKYESMIQYSRPLFAKLHKNNSFDKTKEYEVVKKVILGRADWKKDKKSCLSVLGTRIQMGRTSTPIVSDLVSKGYAHLTYYEHGQGDVLNRASFAFLPDPVCARIAMCLMDDRFKFHGNSSGPKVEFDICGAKRTEMATMMGTIFSEGICLPAKGDYGEIATALYILFCGDILRKQKCAEYKEFSVSFSKWMGLIQNQGKSEGADNQDGDNQDGGKILSVNCIQFFRQDLRLKLDDMANETFLKGLYQKACAIYCKSNFEAIDLVVPCFYENDNRFLPAAFSVKNYGYMSPEDATFFLYESWSKLNQAGIKQGLCVLVIIGQDRPFENVSAENYKTQAIDMDISVKIKKGKRDKQKKNENEQKEKDCPENVSARDDGSEAIATAETLEAEFKIALRKSPSEMIDSLVPCFVCIHGDDFGIDSVLKLGSTLKAHQESEVFVNHSDLIQGSYNDIGISPGSDLSRFTSRYRQAAANLFEETVNLKPQEKEE